MSDPEQSSGASGDSNAGSGNADDGKPGGGTNDEHASPELAPVPPEGTSAPVDSERVFGRPDQSDQSGKGGKGGKQPSGQPSGQQAGTEPTPAPSWPPASDGPQVSDEERKRLRTRGRLALVFGIVAVPTAILLFPLGLGLGVAAIVLGALAYRTARRVSLVAAGAVPGIVLGIVATVLASVAAAVTLTFWAEVSEFTSCQEGAITHVAQAKCQRTFERQIEERLLGGSGPSR